MMNLAVVITPYLPVGVIGGSYSKEDAIGGKAWSPLSACRIIINILISIIVMMYYLIICFIISYVI